MNKTLAHTSHFPLLFSIDENEKKNENSLLLFYFRLFMFIGVHLCVYILFVVFRKIEMSLKSVAKVKPSKRRKKMCRTTLNNNKVEQCTRFKSKSLNFYLFCVVRCAECARSMQYLLHLLSFTSEMHISTRKRFVNYQIVECAPHDNYAFNRNFEQCGPFCRKH